MTLEETTNANEETTQPETTTETETTPAAPVEGQEAKTDDSAQSDSTVEDEPAAAAPKQTDEEKHRRAGGWQRKIDRLERENAAKQAILDQLLQKQGAPAPTTPAAEPTSEDKVAAYIAKQVEERLAAREEAARQAELQKQFNQRYEAVRSVNPDFDEVIATCEAQVSPALNHVFLTSEHGPALMYQLAKNPAELDRLSRLAPLDAAREIGRLEAQAASGTATPKTTTKPTTLVRKPAPVPITPVTARGPTNVKPVSDMTQDEYNAWRDSQRKR